MTCLSSKTIPSLDANEPSNKLKQQLTRHPRKGRRKQYGFHCVAPSQTKTEEIPLPEPSLTKDQLKRERKIPNTRIVDLNMANTKISADVREEFFSLDSTLLDMMKPNHTWLPAKQVTMEQAGVNCMNSGDSQTRAVQGSIQDSIDRKLARRNMLKQLNDSTNKSSVQSCKPGANGELLNEMNANNCVKANDLSIMTKKCCGDAISGAVVQDRCGSRVKGVTKPRKGVVLVRKVISSTFRTVEQNVPCSAAFSTTNNFPRACSSQICLKASSNSHESSTDQCRYNNSKGSDPCVCECKSREGSQKLSQITALSSTLSEEKFVNLGSVQVQTSFPSSIGPCQQGTCPKRKGFVDNRNIEVQTDDTDIEWQYEPMPLTRSMHKKDFTLRNSAFKIPPKRTETMDDRLLRRIAFFDSHQSSVCNKNVQFCTYSVHQTKKLFPKNAQKVDCQDCPGSRKCRLALSQDHLTCNEIVIEVKSLELNQEGVDCLKKVCSFLYIDYVFLGHVGNETSLAPVSNKIYFDSRKSYSISLRFNKKERSILREQFNPSGLLAKDTIMFIVVCQAAPEFDMNKNWDFGFGCLSMKQIGERVSFEDSMAVDVEMRKIGGTKNDIGKLTVAIEGLKTVKSIMNEKLDCIEPRVDALTKKFTLNKKELIAAQNNQSTCKRRERKK